MANTIYLDPDTWDMTVDSFGNWAMASPPYAVAQDVASECRLWLGEARYDANAGIPYEKAVLGELPPPAKLISWYKKAAEGVPLVDEADPILMFDKRVLSGEIHVSLTNGEDFNLTI